MNYLMIVGRYILTSHHNLLSQMFMMIVSAFARAFAGHHQIVCAIISQNGDNNYLAERGGMSFGVRRSYMTDHEGKGVIPVPLAMDESKTVQAQIINEMTSRGLKYEMPEISTLKNAKLTNSMKEFLLANMHPDRMTTELWEYWDRKLYLKMMNLILGQMMYLILDRMMNQ